MKITQVSILGVNGRKIFIALSICDLIQSCFGFARVHFFVIYTGKRQGCVKSVVE
jgi:hypothetical protein